MPKQPIHTHPVIRNNIKSGECYYLFSFEGKSHNISYGKIELIKRIGKYVFTGDGIYKAFDAQEIKKLKTGQPIRGEIRNGKLTFLSFFMTKDDAEKSANIFPKNVAILLLKKSIDIDKRMIEDMKQSILGRITMINNIITAKNLSVMAESIKKSSEKK